MFKVFKYLLGLWAGATLIAAPVAWLVLYVMVGKVPMLHKTGLRLMTVDDATDHVRSLVEKGVATYHG
ncbi:MAG TPA: hypothetical protein GX714_00455 [Chloroflexi bacterium]|jgi:hypothetical protein|nr:hypothetical protein [Chloroflexota bacterium]